MQTLKTVDLRVSVLFFGMPEMIILRKLSSFTVNRFSIAANSCFITFSEEALASLSKFRLCFLTQEL